MFEVKASAWRVVTSKTSGERAPGPFLWSDHYRPSVRLVPAAVRTALGLR
jgi:hypothetical protein